MVVVSDVLLIIHILVLFNDKVNKEILSCLFQQYMEIWNCKTHYGGYLMNDGGVDRD